MLGIKITKKFVDTLRPKPKDEVYFDCDLKGFGIRVRASGAMTYVVVYRNGSGRSAQSKKLTLGAVGKITPEEARLLAKKAIGSVAHGLDPAAQKSAARQAITIKELGALFLKEHVLAKRRGTTPERYQHVIDRYIVPELGSFRAEHLSKDAVGRFHLKLKAKPSIANYAVAVLSSMYGFAQSRGLVPDLCNPTRRVERFREVSKERYLTELELARLGEALREAETVGIPWQVDETKTTAKHAPKLENRRTVFAAGAVAALRLLLFTGCRLREILHLEWRFIDFERGIIFLPDSKTGAKPVMMNPSVIAVLESLPRVDAFVVPGDKPGRPRHDLQKIWLAVRKRADLLDVRIHDLRHTFASVGAGSGLGLPIIGKLLGHKQAATTARYAHFADDPMRRASEAISGTIASALAVRTVA